MFMLSKKNLIKFELEPFGPNQIGLQSLYRAWPNR